MKKLIALILTVVLCLGALAGCEKAPEAPTVDALANAKAYLFTMYKDKAGKTMRDFDLVGAVSIGGVSYTVEWTTNVSEDLVKVIPGDKTVTIDLVNEKPEEDVLFTLTATVKDAEGKTASTSFEYYIPGVPVASNGPTFVEAPEVGKTYKYALVQAERGETLYFTGEMNGNYLATSVDPTKAVDVTIEEVEGGVRFFFMVGETKNYIDINEYQEGKAGVRITTEPTATFVWNEECKVYTAEVAGAHRYLGTYSTYNTISASDIKYIAGENVAKIGVSQFPAGFCTVSFQVKAVEGQPAVGTTGLFYLTQAERGETLFFTGEMNGSYLATTTNPSKGVDVTIEEVEGGYRMSFVKNGEKLYIDINEYQEGKAGVRITAEPTAVFVWNEECGVFTAEVAGAPRYLGTYSTYNTISASDIKYIAGENVAKIGVSQFPAGFGSMVWNFVAAEGQPAVGTYKYALVQAERGETLYFAGAMNGNYLATTTNAGAAADVTIEEVEGGFRFFFMEGETKMYIDINEYQEGKAGVRITAEPTATFVWNEECGVFTAEVAGAPRYLGTYSTYNTISASDIKYIAGENLAKIGVSQFPAGFGTATPAM